MVSKNMKRKNHEYLTGAALALICIAIFVIIFIG